MKEQYLGDCMTWRAAVTKTAAKSEATLVLPKGSETTSIGSDTYAEVQLPTVKLLHELVNNMRRDSEILFDVSSYCRYVCTG